MFECHVNLFSYIIIMTIMLQSGTTYESKVELKHRLEASA